MDNSASVQNYEVTTVVEGKRGNASGNVEPYSDPLMVTAYDEKTRFPVSVLNSVFAAKRITTIVKAFKEATTNELEKIYQKNTTYLLDIVSFKPPHVDLRFS